jgi:hypothetical protein
MLHVPDNNSCIKLDLYKLVEMKDFFTSTDKLTVIPIVVSAEAKVRQQMYFFKQLFLEYQL